MYIFGERWLRIAWLIADTRRSSSSKSARSDVANVFHAPRSLYGSVRRRTADRWLLCVSDSRRPPSAGRTAGRTHPRAGDGPIQPGPSDASKLKSERGYLRASARMKASPPPCRPSRLSGRCLEWEIFPSVVIPLLLFIMKSYTKYK